MPASRTRRNRRRLVIIREMGPELHTPPDPGPRWHAAAVHRTLSTLAGTPTDPWFGCAFPGCGCTATCPIHASLTPQENPHATTR